MAGDRLKLSVVIPAHNEAGSIEETVNGIVGVLVREGIDHEVLVVDDASSDDTGRIVRGLGHPSVRCERSHNPGGFGFAVRSGLDDYTGDAAAVMMADGSDDPEDLVLYYRLLEAGYDCAFGSRFMPGAVVTGYPRFKLVINRIVNFGIRVLFRHGYNDTTNAFKAYRRDVVDHVQPLLSNHFNLTVELPLKAVVRGYSYAIVPTQWRGRTAGASSLALQEMGSRYLFIVFMVLLEHYLSRGDYRRPGYARRAAPQRAPADRVEAGRLRAVDGEAKR
ncbi:MAG TPA: glycosyltransferase family 2 protein [Solirubrobacteraceae bacterium]|nr:glycosyltransferase family 2 protein [Solirubrobacteraceae bacterium]